MTTRVQVGKKIRTLPQSTATSESRERAALLKQVKRTEELQKVHAAQLTTVKAEAAAARLEGYRANVRANATSFFARDVNGPQLAKAVNNVVNAFDRHVYGGGDPLKFDVVNECKTVRYARGISDVPPAPQATALADQRLPPPNAHSLGATLPAHSLAPGLGESEHARDRQRAEHIATARERAESERVARERYRENLRRQGLQDPSTYSPCG